MEQSKKKKKTTPKNNPTQKIAKALKKVWDKPTTLDNMPLKSSLF